MCYMRRHRSCRTAKSVTTITAMSWPAQAAELFRYRTSPDDPKIPTRKSRRGLQSWRTTTLVSDRIRKLRCPALRTSHALYGNCVYCTPSHPQPHMWVSPRTPQHPHCCHMRILPISWQTWSMNSTPRRGKRLGGSAEYRPAPEGDEVKPLWVTRWTPSSSVRNSTTTGSLCNNIGGLVGGRRFFSNSYY